jgi:hypothetical protein
VGWRRAPQSPPAWSSASADARAVPRGPAGPVLRRLRAAAAVALALALWAGTGWAVQRVAAPPAPVRLRLVVAAAGGGTATPAEVAAVEHEARLAVAWLEAQVGRRLTAVLDDPVVIPVDVPRDTGQDEAAAADRILAAVRRGLPDPGLLPLVVTDVAMPQEAEGWATCGVGGPGGIVVYPRNCGLVPFARTPAFGSGTSTVVAHELVHAMGAVAPCAPNAVAGHVVDDPRDLMAAVLDPAAGPPLLDAGRDDYLGHGLAGCPDIRDSALWSG